MSTSHPIYKVHHLHMSTMFHFHPTLLLLCPLFTRFTGLTTFPYQQFSTSTHFCCCYVHFSPDLQVSPPSHINNFPYPPTPAVARPSFHPVYHLHMPTMIYIHPLLLLLCPLCTRFTRFTTIKCAQCSTSTHSCCCYANFSPGLQSSPPSRVHHFPHQPTPSVVMSTFHLTYKFHHLPISTIFHNHPLLLLLCQLFTRFTKFTTFPCPPFSTSTHSFCCYVHLSPVLQGSPPSHINNFAHPPTPAVAMPTFHLVYHLHMSTMIHIHPLALLLCPLLTRFTRFTTFTCAPCCTSTPSCSCCANFSPDSQRSHGHRVPFPPTPAFAVSTFHPVQQVQQLQMYTIFHIRPILLLLCKLFTQFTTITCPP